MPTLVESYNVNAATANTVTLVSPSFTPNAGDILVVKAMTWQGSDPMGTPTDTQGNTYAQRVVIATTRPYATIWTTTAATSTSMTVSLPIAGSACEHSMVVERWSGAALDITPAVNGTKTGSGAPTSTITTTQDSSAVTWCSGDDPGQDPTGRVYNSTSGAPTEDGINDKNASNGTVQYYATQGCGSAGSQTVGMTAPTGQTWSLVAMEVLHVSGVTAEDQTTFGTLAWQ